MDSGRGLDHEWMFAIDPGLEQIVSREQVQRREKWIKRLRAMPA